MVDHSTLFYQNNLFFQFIYGLTWQVDIVKTLCSKAIDNITNEKFGCSDVVLSGLGVVLGGLVVVWVCFGLHGRST